MFLFRLDSSTPKASETVLMLKLRKMLDEEIDKRRSLEKEIVRVGSKTSVSSSNNEDSIR